MFSVVDFWLSYICIFFTPPPLWVRRRCSVRVGTRWKLWILLLHQKHHIWNIYISTCNIPIRCLIYNLCVCTYTHILHGAAESSSHKWTNSSRAERRGTKCLFSPYVHENRFHRYCAYSSMCANLKLSTHCLPLLKVESYSYEKPLCALALVWKMLHKWMDRSNIPWI